MQCEHIEASKRVGLAARRWIVTQGSCNLLGAAAQGGPHRTRFFGLENRFLDADAKVQNTPR